MVRRLTATICAALLLLALAACARTVIGDPRAAATGTPPPVDTTDTPSPTMTDTTAPPDTTDQPPTPEPPASATSTAPTGPEEDATTSYVYYLVDTRDGLRLARELREIPTDDPAAAVTTAVGAMISGALDPDYTTTWNPDTEVRDIRVTPELITVDLSAAARTANTGSPGAAMMIQQLVWTASDAADQPDTPVLLTIDGEPAGELWGAVDWDEPVAREDPLSIRLLVQIDTPQEGAEMTSPVTVTGDAAVFEAHLPWRVLDADGAVVIEDFTMTEEGMTFAPFSFQVDLEPGAYTIEIEEDDPSDGEAGEPMTDTRSITVTD